MALTLTLTLTQIVQLHVCVLFYISYLVHSQWLYKLNFQEIEWLLYPVDVYTRHGVTYR